MQNQIELFARWHNFSTQDATEIVGIFEKLAEKRAYPFRGIEQPTTAGEYSEIWERFFSRYSTFEELIESEKEQGVYGMTEQECHAQTGKSIFKLTSGLYIQRI